VTIISSSSRCRPSSEIGVGLLRLILFLPFAIEAAGGVTRRITSGEGLADALRRRLLAPGSPWRRQDDLLMHAPPLPEDEVARAGPYEEFVYFYPYVQRFLYGAPKDGHGRGAAGAGVAGSAGGEEGPRPLAVYQRHDIRRAHAAAVAIDAKVTRDFVMRVERTNLNVFDTGHAILAVELALDPSRPEPGQGPQPLSLREAIALVHNMRQVFPPYRARIEGTEMGALPPSFPRVQWIGQQGGAAKPRTTEDHAAHVAATLTPPLDQAWREILSPLSVEGYAPADAEVVLSQCGDDRAPLMVLLAVDEPEAIAASDWYRLAIGDPPDDPGVRPVASSAARAFESRFCYDAFWQPNRPTFRTRQVCSGSIYAMVGEDTEFFRNTLQVHFRRHYHQLALISHYHRAALVSLSERMADAVQPGARGGSGVEQFSREAHEIQRDVLRFTNRYWFVEVTPQQQGRDLFAMWRRHLGTVELYEQLSQELQSTTAFLHAEEDGRIAKSTHRIALWGVPGIVIAACTGALGMNIFKESGDAIELGLWAAFFSVLGVSLSFWIGVQLVMSCMDRRSTDPDAGEVSRSPWPPLVAAAVALLLGAAGLAALGDV
jgi:hypothetical protein